MLRNFIISLFVLFFSHSFCFANITGIVDYNVPSVKDTTLLLKKANDNIRLYEKTEDEKQKSVYLKEALRYYYICTKLDFSIIDAHIGLGKVYDEMGIDKYAKMEFNTAYNINKNNPLLNYRYGDFYYKRHQLALAQNYFETAYKNGYSNNIDLNIKMSKAYVKLAQPQKAQEHKKIANDLSAAQKIKVSTVNNAIKQSKGVASIPSVSISSNNELPKQKSDFMQTDTNNKISFEDAVKKASQIKMIDELDNIRPMYYLFMK